MTPARVYVKNKAAAARLVRNAEGKGKRENNQSSALLVSLRKAKSVFDHAGSSNDLWMAKKYIEKALELLETRL